MVHQMDPSTPMLHPSNVCKTLPVILFHELPTTVMQSMHRDRDNPITNTHRDLVCAHRDTVTSGLSLVGYLT